MRSAFDWQSTPDFPSSKTLYHPLFVFHMEYYLLNNYLYDVHTSVTVSVFSVTELLSIVMFPTKMGRVSSCCFFLFLINHERRGMLIPPNLGSPHLQDVEHHLKLKTVFCDEGRVHLLGKEH